MLPLHTLIKEGRLRKKISAKAVSEAVGIPLKTYEVYESGKRSPKSERLNKLITFLELDKDAVVEALFEPKKDNLNAVEKGLVESFRRKDVPAISRIVRRYVMVT